MEIDDDIVLIKDNKPKEPTEDPLEVHPGDSQCSVEFIEQATLNSIKNKTDNVINVDSSDDEACVISQRNRESSSQLKGNTTIEIKNKGGDGVILRPLLEKTLNQVPLPNDIIDLDVEDSDPLAPLRSFMNTLEIKNKPNPTENTNNCSNTTKTKIMTLSNSRIKLPAKTFHNSKVRGKTNQLPLKGETAKIPLKPSINEVKDQTRAADSSKNLTYLGKIIRIPGQPNVIEDPSGLIFRANSSSDLNNDADSNSETDMNLYKNFLINVSGQDSSQNVLVKDVHKANQNVSTPSLEILDGSKSHNRLSKNIHNINQDISNPRSNHATKTLNIPGKKMQLNGNGHQNIPYKSHESNSTVLDLNLNINDTGSPSTTRSRNTPSQSTLRLPNDSSGGYNVALGLVVNVNDMNQSNSNYCQIAPKFTSVNNVALDVSFNVNNKGKPATITSKQATQKSPTPGESSVSYQDALLKDFTNNSAGIIYCCSNCSFKTGKVNVIKSHVCLFPSSVTPVPSQTDTEEQTQISSKNNDTNPIKQITDDLFCCNLCSFKTLNSDLWERHESSHNTTEIDISNTNQHLTTDSIENLPMEKMYCCVACSLQTTDFEVINEHNCPAVNRVITNNGNSYFKNPNLIHNTGISSHKSRVETEIYQAMKEQNIYKCASCSFQTTNLTLMNFHECCSKSEIGKSIETAKIASEKTNQITLKEKLMTEEQVEENSPTKFYCCVSCSFKTATFEFAQTHRCRESNIIGMNEPPLAIPNQKKLDDEGLANSFNKQTIYLCEICKKNFKSKFPLFQHLRRTHFDVCKLFGCYLCYCYFENVDDLLRHLELKHNSAVKNAKAIAITKEEAYRCRACHYQTKILRNMKPHFDKHMEGYESIMQICWKSFQEDVCQDTPKDDIFEYECLLCGRKTNSILMWLKHVCKDPLKVSNISRRKQNELLEDKPEMVNQSKTVKRTYKRKCIQPVSSGKLPCIATEKKDPVRSSRLPRCFHCKHPIIKDVLKCDNSECENVYHLRCVDICGRWLSPQDVNRSSNWFCLECNKESITVQDDIDHIERCMNIANKAYLDEVEKQSMWINEVKKIKQEKITLKEEFDRIKNFIMNCKSDRINNDMVKSVCSVVESFINAGLDSSD